MSVYEAVDYKAVLREKLLEKKARVSSRFTFERLATACGVQKTYLSRVLNSSDAHLSDDQLYQAAAFLGLSRDERHYLALLREQVRTQVAERRQELRAEIDSIRRRQQRSEAHLAAETLPAGQVDVSAYYLDPNVMLVHIFLAIAYYREDPRRISGKLGISEEALTAILSSLERMQLIALRQGRYELTKENTHLPADAALYQPYRFMQRLKTIERTQRLPRDRNYNFSVVFSATDAVRREIHARFLALLGDVEKAVTTSADEEVFQMNFDLFDWSMD